MGMDRVRFGRALGWGARQALKTLMSAADAATAKSTSSSPSRAASTMAPAGNTGQRSSITPSAATRPGAGQTAVKAVGQVREVHRGVRRGTKRFGEAIWGPFVRLSGVLWLEVSGVFFGIFALMALGYLWKLRGAWHAGASNAATHRNFMGAVVMLVLFGYFSVSSFMRARRRERRR